MLRRSLKPVNLKKATKSSPVQVDDTKIQHSLKASNSKVTKKGSCPLDPCPCDPCSLCSPCNPLYTLCLPCTLCCGASLLGSMYNLVCCFDQDDDCCDDCSD